MKKFLIVTILLSTFGFQSVAQEELNCYYKWEKKFEQRGATDVPDGEHANIIITVRQGSNASCFTGKCTVSGGMVTAMYRQLEDGTYELYKPEARYNLPITITNGISKTLPTLDNELINVLFIKNIKPPKANFKAAPNPEDF
jgi:hypothetical protein